MENMFFYNLVLTVAAFGVIVVIMAGCAIAESIVKVAK